MAFRATTRTSRPQLGEVCRLLSRAGLVIALQCAWCGLAVSPASAQPVPLADVVPLDELETPVDELIRLTTDYADAVRDWKSAKLTSDALQVLRPNSLTTNLEVQLAMVNVQATEGKLQVLRAICEKQLAAATIRLELVKRLEKIPAAAAAQPGSSPPEAAVSHSRIRVMQAEATVSILKMILAIK